MKRLNPPFSGRSPLKSVSARLFIGAGFLLIFSCTYLLSQEGVGQNLLLAFLDPPDQTVPEQSEPDPAEISADREALIHRIYRNRSLRTQFERAEQKFHEREFTEGALQLEKLLDHQEDYFFWPDDQKRPFNFRQRTRELLSTATPRVLSDYERISGPQASSMLEQARQSDDLRLFEQIALRFFPLQAGFEALDYLGTRHLEQGNFDFASRYWDLLLESRIHQSRMQPVHFLKAAVSYQQSGQQEKVARILAARRKARVSLGGKTLSLPQAVGQLALTLQKVPRAQENRGWLYSQGNPQRNQSIDASVPYFKADWSQPIARTEKHRALESLINWERKQQRENQSTAVANLPIAVDNLVVYRDFQGIRAVDLDSGKTDWLFQSAGSLNQLIDEVDARTPGHAAYSQNLSLEKFYSCNSIYGSLSSNGQAVFAVDYLPNQLPPVERNLGLRRSSVQFPLVSQRGNRLVALPVKPPETAADGLTTIRAPSANGQAETILPVKPLWTISGYYFLGAPLPVGNYLYAIAEHNSQLSVLCINPYNGSIYWKQGLAYVNQPIFTDRERSWQQCPLASSEGIVVCTTQIDTLVALDATNGDLLWNYYYGEGDQSRRIAQKRYYRPVSFGHPGLTSAPVISGNRVFYLPSGSPYIHCIDLKSGLPLWEEVNREDGEYIAAVVDDTVLVVGSDYCRGRHVEDGRELWHLQVGPVSGKGFLSHQDYLLPTRAGHVLKINIPSGREVGFSLSNSNQISSILNHDFKQKLRQGAAYAFETVSREGQDSQTSPSQYEWAPGNIIAHRGRIISVGLWQIDSFPQAEAMLASLPGKAPSLNSKQKQADQLLKAELELALGNLTGAQHRLESLLSVKADPDVQDRSEALLRELLYAELNRSHKNEFELLGKLETLAHTPLERGRFLSRKSKYLLDQEDYHGLMQVAEDFKKIEVNQPLAMAGDTHHLVTVQSLIAGLMQRISDKADQNDQATLNTIITEDQQSSLKDASPAALQAFLDTYGSWSQAVEVRSILAEKLKQAGQVQQAEFLLMQNQAHADPSIAAEATRQLLELWESVGLPHETAGLLNELNEKYADVKLENGLTGGEYVQRFNRGSAAWTIFQAMQPLQQKVTHVKIRQSDSGAPVPEIAGTYRNYERKFLPPPEISQLLLKQGSLLSVVNRHAGQTIGQIKVSDRISYPYHSRNTRVGHFIPLGSSRKIHGVSLLQLQDEISSPLWTTEFDDLNNSQSLFYVGPSGPRVCIFQWDNRLFGLNPANGKVLWERKNIPSKSGFLSDSSKGLIGDQEAVVAFSINRTNYDVYSSITGERIRQGELELNSRSRHVFGRKLFYETNSTTEKRVRLWDPLSDRLLLDEPVSSSGFSTQISDTELAILLPKNRLRVLNVETGETVIETVIPDEYLKNLNKFIGFSDHDRYYFNFSYTTPRRRPPQNDFYISDSFLNVVHIDNDLMSIDKQSGKILWNRNLPKRSWIDTSQYRLPFLILMSKIRTESRTRSYSFLFEILDAKTGKTIGFKDNLLKDTILQMQIDPRFKKIILQGMHSAVEIDYNNPTRALDQLLDSPL
ncbi:outer membrane protein assembly factor BamB family protein [Gimesia panareensis]|uniref:outer membrane protein assembly factor BamB family protein n=1 Tax=Gimesia panareensis TaxID=2527978 RepID=UPI00118A712A|nr:PQQ-binding-like beta-propeller repeat protein [Gimesia panareensis]QDU49863.1 outer membrane biogenesis protein BamB [Gimesia panareensis]